MIPGYISRAACAWLSHCIVETLGYIFNQVSQEWSFWDSSVERGGEWQQHSPAWFATQTHIKTFGSTAKAPPPLQSSSRLHESSLLHQQFPLCWELKGASEHWELSAWCRIGLSEWVRGENPGTFMWALWIPNYEWLIVFGLAGHTPAHLHSLCWTTLKMNLTWDICSYKTTLAAKLWHKHQNLTNKRASTFSLL